jgi:hypothetical protein
MKKIILLLIVSLPVLCGAQSLIGGKNIIKASLTSAAIGNYQITYERAFLKRMSLSLSYRYMPKRAVPLQWVADQFIKTDDIKFSEFQMGNNAFTPELRIYLGLGKMKGFYVAPYARIASFDLSVPVKYENTSLPGSPAKYAVLNGTIRSTSGGVMLGIQHQFLKKLVLDFWIIGGHWGSSNGDLVADNISPGMTVFERDNLQKTLDDLKEIGPFKFEGKVESATRATAKSVGPWAGFRGAGLCIGIRF